MSVVSDGVVSDGIVVSDGVVESTTVLTTLLTTAISTFSPTTIDHPSTRFPPPKNWTPPNATIRPSSFLPRVIHSSVIGKFCITFARFSIKSETPNETPVGCHAPRAYGIQVLIRWVAQKIKSFSLFSPPQPLICGRRKVCRGRVFLKSHLRRVAASSGYGSLPLGALATKYQVSQVLFGTRPRSRLLDSRNRSQVCKRALLECSRIDRPPAQCQPISFIRGVIREQLTRVQQVSVRNPGIF